jgi:hypothetical protein
MAYGKTKAFVVAGVLAAIPIGIQWQENQQLQLELATLRPPGEESAARRSGNSSRPNAAPHVAPSAPADSGQPDPSLSTPQTAKVRGKRLLSVPGLKGEGEVFPLPFEDLKSLTMSPLDQDGSLSPQMARILRMDSREEGELNQMLKEYRLRVWQHEKENIVPVAVEDDEQTYRIDASPKLNIKAEMGDGFREILGEERADFFASRFSSQRESAKMFGHFGERNRTITFEPKENDLIQVSVTSEDPESGNSTKHSSTARRK